MPRRGLPRWARWGGVTLADPSDDEIHGPAGDTAATGTAAWGRALWRPWMIGPVLLVAVLVSSQVRMDRDLVHPSDILDASTLVTVTPPADRDPGPVRGAWLMPMRTEQPTVLEWMLALPPVGARVAPAAPHVIGALDPIESAVLTAVGVAPARSSAEQMGFVIDVDPQVPRASVGLLLLAYDRASPLDVAAGRTILALGALDHDGRLRCPADAARSITASSPPPDVVVIGEGCPAAAEAHRLGVPVIEGSGFPDVLFAVAASPD